MRRREVILAAAGAAAAGRPRRAAAEAAPARKRVAILMSTAERDPHELSSVAAFVGGLAKRGWVEGQDLDLFVRWGAADPQRLAANAREVVGLAPDAILAKGAAIPYARKATSTIPIVFVITSDAAAQAYVGSLSRPSGNMTGFASPEQDLVGKRLQILREAFPGIARVLYIRSALGPPGLSRSLYLRAVEYGTAVGLRIADGVVDSTGELARAIETFARKPGGALLAAWNAFTTVHRVEIVEFAARHRLPAMYPLRIFAQGGGLMSFGLSQVDEFRHAASYAGRILRGAKPHDLPVQLPTRFKLVINLKTAKALGLTVPRLLLAQADELIQ